MALFWFQAEKVRHLEIYFQMVVFLSCFTVGSLIVTVVARVTSCPVVTSTHSLCTSPNLLSLDCWSHMIGSLRLPGSLDNSQWSYFFNLFKKSGKKNICKGRVFSLSSHTVLDFSGMFVYFIYMKKIYKKYLTGFHLPRKNHFFKVRIKVALV